MEHLDEDAMLASRSPNRLQCWVTSFPWLSRVTRRVPTGQFLRYLLVGIWNTVFGYGTYALLTALLMPKLRFGYIYAAVLSNLISITVAFFGYKIFVFKTKGNYLVEWFRCILIYGAGMLPGLVLLPLVVEGLHHGFGLERSAPYLGGALVMGLTVIASFFGHRYFTFRNPRNPVEEAVGDIFLPADLTSSHDDESRRA